MFRTLTLALCLSAAATSASAESFLERMARQAAEKAVQKATDKVMNGGSSSSDSNRPKDDDDPQAGQVLTPKPRTASPSSAPAAAPAPKVKTKKAPPPGVYPGTITAGADVKAKKDAFDEFGKVRCSDCEGGYSYDSWTQIFFNGELAGEYNGWAKKLGKLNVGDRLTWKGKASNGTLTVVSENPIEGFRCKQLTYRLDKPQSFAERPGLLCWGKLNEYSSNDSWVIVY